MLSAAENHWSCPYANAFLCQPVLWHYCLLSENTANAPTQVSCEWVQTNASIRVQEKDFLLSKIAAGTFLSQLHLLAFAIPTYPQ